MRERVTLLVRNEESVHGWLERTPDGTRPVSRLWLTPWVADKESAGAARSMALCRRFHQAFPGLLAGGPTRSRLDVAFGPFGYSPVLWYPAYLDDRFSDRPDRLVPVVLARLGFPTKRQALDVVRQAVDTIVAADLLYFVHLTQEFSENQGLDLEGVMPCHAVDRLVVHADATVKVCFNGAAWEPIATKDVAIEKVEQIVCDACGAELHRPALPADVAR